MDRKPSDISPEIPSESDERLERYPSEEPQGEVNDDPNFQDPDEDLDDDEDVDDDIEDPDRIV